MTFTLYIRDKDASALKLCACIAAGADNVDINVVPQGGDVAKKVDLPLPSQGLPALIAENGSVIQECHAAAKLLGTPAVARLLNAKLCCKPVAAQRSIFAVLSKVYTL